MILSICVSIYIHLFVCLVLFSFGTGAKYGEHIARIKDDRTGGTFTGGHNRMVSNSDDV